MDCTVPRVNYGDFSKALHGRAWSGRTVPVNGTIEITQRCNLRCVHCYVPWAGRLSGKLSESTVPGGSPSDQDRQPHRVETPREPLRRGEILRLLDEMVAEGCLWLLITGGEPLVRRDFLEIYEHAKKLGLLVILFTNATLVTPRIADRLVEYPPFNIEVTLYGATPGTYESITGVPGSFRQCVRGVELLMERRLPLSLKTIVLQPNLHELDDMRRFADQRGLQFRWDALVHSQLNRCHDPLQHRLTSEEVVQIELRNPDRLAAWTRLIERGKRIRADDRVFKCGAGIGSFHVDAFGFLRPCEFAPGYKYDLRRGTFHEGYHSYFPIVRSLRRGVLSTCDRCELMGACPMCVAWEQLEGNGQNVPVEFVCRYFQLLASALEAPSSSSKAVVEAAQAMAVPRL